MSLTQIDSSKVKGEVGTGYEGPNGKGPFSCSNCEYFRNGSCGQETMMDRSKLPKTENGRVVVDPNGCCEYVDRLGKKSENKEEPMKKNWMKVADKSADGPTVATEENQHIIGAAKKPDARPGKRMMKKGQSK